MTELEIKVEALMRCVDPEKLRAALAEVTPADKAAVKRLPSMEEAMYREIRAALLEIGVPNHLKGYRYVVSGVGLVVQNEDLLDMITDGLYPAIAKMHDTTKSKVERAVRHAIEVAWDRGDRDVLYKLFGNTVSNMKGKPTNGEFFARMRYEILDRMGGGK